MMGFWLDKISELGIATHIECEVIRIENDRIRVRRKEDPEDMGPFSSFVVATGYQSDNSLGQELEKEKGKLPFTIHSVGDCVSPRNVLHAISEGYNAAYSL